MAADLHLKQKQSLFTSVKIRGIPAFAEAATRRHPWQSSRESPKATLGLSKIKPLNFHQFRNQESNLVLEIFIKFCEVKGFCFC